MTIFHTHDKAQGKKADKTHKIIHKIILISCGGLMCAFPLFLAIYISIAAPSILPVFIILIPIIGFHITAIINMNRSYVSVDGDDITVVDYLLFSKKERKFSIHEIKMAETAIGYSFRVRGYRYAMAGISYIIFRDSDGKYLFKIINCPQTKDFFGKYFEIEQV